MRLPEFWRRARSGFSVSRSISMAAGCSPEASTRRTPDVSAALLQAGLVRRYAGGRREHWC